MVVGTSDISIENCYINRSFVILDKVTENSMITKSLEWKYAVPIEKVRERFLKEMNKIGDYKMDGNYICRPIIGTQSYYYIDKFESIIFKRYNEFISFILDKGYKLNNFHSLFYSDSTVVVHQNKFTQMWILSLLDEIHTFNTIQTLFYYLNNTKKYEHTGAVN